MDISTDEMDKWLYVQIPGRRFDISSEIFERRGNDNYFRCLLCHAHGEDKFFSRSDMEQHCLAVFHQNQINRLENHQEQSRRCHLLSQTKLESMEPRIQALGLLSWQNSVRLELYPYVTATLLRGKDALTVMDWGDKEAILSHYEKMEWTSLLELAVWKGTCIMEKSDELYYYEMLRWKEDGWQANKEKMRRDSAISVIVGCVIPFLD